MDSSKVVMVVLTVTALVVLVWSGGQSGQRSSPGDSARQAEMLRKMNEIFEEIGKVESDAQRAVDGDSTIAAALAGLKAEMESMNNAARQQAPAAVPVAAAPGDAKFASSAASGERKMPFEMPVEGKAWKLMQPYYDFDTQQLGEKLLAPANHYVDSYTKRIQWIRSFGGKDASGMHLGAQAVPAEDFAMTQYLELVRMLESGLAYGTAELTTHPATGGANIVSKLDVALREQGGDWPLLGDTMTGTKRLHNVRDLVTTAVRDGIEGDYIETGVWRGGSSVFARAVLNSLGQHNRVSYVCDSFHGLPPGERNLDGGDKNWNKQTYLYIPPEIVAQNFNRMNLLDENVVFAKGYFNETMPQLKTRVKKLAVLRFDGDIYESAVDVLYNMYDKLQVGGYFICDDWYGFPSKTAIEDFFKVHDQPLPNIVQIDSLATWWKKEVDFPIQYERYTSSNFKP
eukprot:TRINITY_DN75_c1_g4_i1.p1 TRINITY_DN75_c1_g4~~TRINITY_DN75_c1_g4_i1.p1  ORF type:complete len:456 (+),score=164.17 TRINITY_DN75_c1_g4_i1:112-1479(+)